MIKHTINLEFLAADEREMLEAAEALIAHGYTDPADDIDMTIGELTKMLADLSALRAVRKEATGVLKLLLRTFYGGEEWTEQERREFEAAAYNAATAAIAKAEGEEATQ